MTLRLEYRDVAPEGVAALAELNRYLDSCSIDEVLRRLLEVRISQINRCSYCITVHRRQALAAGEGPMRLAELDFWSESGLFTPAECAALAWAEEVTLISQSGTSDNAYAALQRHFSEAEVVDLTFIVISMNAWNRLAVSFRREA